MAADAVRAICTELAEHSRAPACGISSQIDALALPRGQLQPALRRGLQGGRRAGGQQLHGTGGISRQGFRRQCRSLRQQTPGLPRHGSAGVDDLHLRADELAQGGQGKDVVRAAEYQCVYLANFGAKSAHSADVARAKCSHFRSFGACAQGLLGAALYGMGQAVAGLEDEFSLAGEGGVQPAEFVTA